MADWTVQTLASKRLTRRHVLHGTLASAGLALGQRVLTGFPAVHAAEPMLLHIAGTGVNQYQQIATKAKGRPRGDYSVHLVSFERRGRRETATQPASAFDLLDGEYWMLAKIIPTGNMRGIDVKRIANYERMVSVFTKGTLPNGQAVSRQGTAPIKVSYLQGELANTFATEPTQWMTLIPTVYNADTLGIRPDLIGRPITQWRELLNPEFRGKAAILNIPSIGIMDAAMVSESMGALQ
jgi:putative spermidine/putrescine transport system substrate-binding protein